MVMLACRLAMTDLERRCAITLRREAFGSLPGVGARSVEQEQDAWDLLETTLHWVVYADGIPVATVRLILPPGSGRGFPFNDAFELEDHASVQPVAFAQAGRVCVDPRWRRSRALSLLFSAMYAESLSLGVTHWLAAVNCSTDVPEDAAIVHQLVLARGPASERFQARARPAAVAGANCVPYYRPEQRRRAERGAVFGLPLPGPVALCARKLGARCMGPPAVDRGFGMFALPLVVDVRGIPAKTVRFAPGPGCDLTVGGAA